MANHPIVHIEIPSANAKATGEFYQHVFDWSIVTSPEFDYLMFRSEGGPAGGFPELGSVGNYTYKPDRILVYLESDDIDASLAEVEAHGGKTVLSKTEIPGVGWWAVFTDPAGNHLALFTSTNANAS